MLVQLRLGFETVLVQNSNSGITQYAFESLYKEVAVLLQFSCIGMFWRLENK